MAKKQRKLLGFWNSYTFFNTYAVIDEPDLENFTPREQDFTVTDKWLIEITNAFLKDSFENYNEHKSYNVVRDFEKLIDDISNFYIRTNRRRFWKSENESDKLTAYWCLYHALKAITVVMAPILPFMCERIWQGLVREVEKDAPISVLLESYPSEVYKANYSEYVNNAAVVKNVITLAGRLRNEHQLKVKQPLSKVYVVSHDKTVTTSVHVFESLLKEELNVKNVINTADGTQFNNYYLTVNFKNAGAVLKGEVQKLKAMLESYDQNTMNSLVAAFDSNSLVFDEFGKLDASLFVKNSKPKPEFVLASENNITVVLDTTLTPELINEGILRELIRNAQVLRKEADFNIEARVLLNISTSDMQLQTVIHENSAKIKEEVLAEKLNQESFSPDIEKEVIIGEVAVTIALKTL